LKRRKVKRMNLNNDNYFSPEAMTEYWSVSQFKSFNKCEAAGLAELRGDWYREETDALLIGGYVDAYFSGEMERFEAEHGEKMYKKRGSGLLAKFEQANELIERVQADALMMEYLAGEKQVIMQAELFGVPWKVKLDVYDEERIVDLKCVRDFGSIWDESYGGRRSWVEYWGYDIQGAVYQKIEQISSQRAEPLPFYIVAVTKEKTPDVAIIRLPQHMLDTALSIVESKIDEFDLVKSGEIPPKRCEKCDWCKSTKILTEPSVYEMEDI
jgi:hypothetical protein